MGDAAHPMYPRGSNGAAQALIDARTLADLLAGSSDPRAALAEYEKARLDTTARIVRTNRTVPPDFIIMKVDELTGGRPFDRIEDVISAEELRRILRRLQGDRGLQPAELNALMSPGLRSILFTSAACSSSAWIFWRANSSSATFLPATSFSSS